MLTAVAPRAIRLHRAPLLDPPFDDELVPTTYRPSEPPPVPPAAIAGASPDAHSAAMRFGNFCLELVNGFRTPAQLRPLIDGDGVLEELHRILHLSVHMRRQTSDSKVRRHTMRVCEPAEGVAEAAVVLSNAARTFALMYRMEKRTSTWKCAYLKFLI